MLLLTVRFQLHQWLAVFSDLRQIPDTQEVFLYPNSSVSIVIEILERVEPALFSDAVRFGLSYDLLSSINDLPQVPFQFNQTDPDQVQILMGLFRVQNKQIDLVVTFNVPVRSQDGGAVGQDGWSAANADFHVLVSSLKIEDFGLFA
jgi:hypothetical protein